MFDAIKSFFSSSMSPSAEAAPESAKKDLRLAACALLLELAHADDEFTDEERQHLTKRSAASSASTPRPRSSWNWPSRPARSAVDLWQFTNLITGELLPGPEDGAGRDHVGAGVLRRRAGVAGRTGSCGRSPTSCDLEPGYLAEARRRRGGRGGAIVRSAGLSGERPPIARPAGGRRPRTRRLIFGAASTASEPTSGPAMRDLVPGGYSSPTRLLVRGRVVAVGTQAVAIILSWGCRCWCWSPSARPDPARLTARRGGGAPGNRGGAPVLHAWGRPEGRARGSPQEQVTPCSS